MLAASIWFDGFLATINLLFLFKNGCHGFLISFFQKFIYLHLFKMIKEIYKSIIKGRLHILVKLICVGLFGVASYAEAQSPLMGNPKYWTWRAEKWMPAGNYNSSPQLAAVLVDTQGAVCAEQGLNMCTTGYYLNGEPHNVCSYSPCSAAVDESSTDISPYPSKIAHAGFDFTIPPGWRLPQPATAIDPVNGINRFYCSNRGMLDESNGFCKPGGYSMQISGIDSIYVGHSGNIFLTVWDQDGVLAPNWPVYADLMLRSVQGRLVCDSQTNANGIASCVYSAPSQPTSELVQATCKGCGDLYPDPTYPIKVTMAPEDLKWGTCDAEAGNPIIPASGEKIETVVDYAGGGFDDLTFSRTYRSRWATDANYRSSVLGVSWTHNHNIQISSDEVVSKVIDGKGYLQIFNRRAGDGGWDAVGSSDTLVKTSSGWSYKRASDGALLNFNEAGYIVELRKPNGQTISYGYSAGQLRQVIGSSGRALTFNYSDSGFLSGIVTPSGDAITYAFDASGRLSSVKQADNTTQSYIYEDTSTIHFLTGIVREDGARFATFSYDTYGRAVSTEHAGGVYKFSVNYPGSSGASTEVIDPLGTGRKYTYDIAQSNLAVASTDKPSSTHANGKASRQQNAYGLLEADADFLGTQTMYTWDINRRVPLSTTRGAGTAVAQTTTTTWHPDWRLPVQVAEPGRLTTNVYNGQPDPFNSNAIVSCAPGTALLSDGKPIAVLCKQVVQATTDTDGHMGVSATLQSGVANRARSWTYNTAGQVLTIQDPQSNTTSYAYYSDTTADHTLGDLQTVTNAKGHVTTYSRYNKHGQVLQSSDPNGVLTVNTYDLRQRLLSSSVGGRTTSYSYDPIGQLLQITAADGSWIGYEYDAAHRQVATKDNLGNRIEYTLDNLGHRTAQNVKDPAGVLARSLTRSLDALGRVQQIIGRE